MVDRLRSLFIYAVCAVRNGPGGKPDRMTGVLIDDTESATRLRSTEAEAAQWVRAVDLAAVALLAPTSPSPSCAR